MAKTFLLVILIVFCVFLSYSNILKADFVWDDYLLITGNNLITSFSNVNKIFVSYLFDNFDYYRPIQNLSYLLDYPLFGYNPSGYHIVNILLHCINALLVFFLLKLFFKELSLCFLGALIFGLAPFSTESVSYISGRSDLLFGLFSFLSFFLYIKKKYYFSILSFVLALLSREQAVILPIVLIIYDLFFNKKSFKNNLKYYSYFILIDITYFLLRIIYFCITEPDFFSFRVYFFPERNLVYRILAFAKSMILYLKIIVFPVDLHMERKITVDINSFEPYSLSLVILVIMFIYFSLRIKMQKNKFLILFGFIWYFLLIFPQSCLFFPEIMPEHFIYVSFFGTIILVLSLIEFQKDNIKRLAKLILLCWCLFYFVSTYTHNMNWKDSLRFYKWTLKFSPNSHKVHYLLGWKYLELGQLDLALEEYEKAIGLDKNFVIGKLSFNNIGKTIDFKDSFLSDLHYGVGRILSKNNIFKDAETEFKLALKYNPRLLEAYNNLGCIYIKQNRLKEAEIMFNDLIAINAGFDKAYYNLGVIYVQRGELTRARSSWKTALRINPDYKIVRESLESLSHEK